MNNLKRRKTLIRKLFKEVAKETVGPENLERIKFIILNKYGRGTSYCRSWERLNCEEIFVIVGLNLSSIEYRIKEGYAPSYYNGRPERLNKYILNNRHNALRFVLYHEARHAWQRLNKNKKYRDSEEVRERDADSWALAHIKTRKPAQTKKETILTRPIEWKKAEYIDLYKAGLSTAKIALLCKVKDPRSVRYYLTKAGISLRRK